ncbi:MAG: biotin--[acetyl-CoA-carboxylase] ligase [Bacteroidales bacterium]|nr:biotin--[acetyl-CoA-carboxylase] ligase [Candidatus Colimorpha onthohippi]
MLDTIDIQYFSSLDSTNAYCERLHPRELSEFTVVQAGFQTAGVGQQGNCWESEPDKNLTFSVVLHPYFMLPAHQFLLTQALSLAVVDALWSLGCDKEKVRIKWPNDIYIDNQKVCGILTLNHFSSDAISSSVCGIGLNVNQTSFPDWLPNPVSLSQHLGGEVNMRLVLLRLLHAMENRYAQLRIADRVGIEESYMLLLYRKGVMSHYRYKGIHIQASIVGTDKYGRLMLCEHDGTTIVANLREIVFEQC